MCNMLVLENKIYVLIVCSLVMFVCPSAVHAIESDIFEQPATVKFSNDELGMVLKRLSDDVSIQIIYDEKISKNKVSGSYKDVPFLTVIHRLLNGLNHSLRMDPEKRILLIKGFGKTHYVTTSAKNSSDYITDIGMPISELRALHEKQSEEFAEQLGNMDEFFEEVDMTRGELLDLHERQSAQFKEELQDQEQYLTELGMTRGQLHAMREKQFAAFERELSNDEIILTELGVTRGEHRDMLADQGAAYEKKQNNDSEYLSEIGMTRAEHRRLLAQQMKEFEQSLTK